MSGVRNAELVLAQSRAFLQDQELELSHVLTNSIRDLDRNYQVSRTTFNRRVAAARQVEAVQATYDVGTATLDMLLDAQRRLADAEIAYYRALVDYNVAILQCHFRKNSLLEYNGIYLAEGPWPAKAYFDARKRARERDAAHFINYGYTRPNVLSRGKMPQYMDQPGQPFSSEARSVSDTTDVEDASLDDEPNSIEPGGSPPEMELPTPSEGESAPTTDAGASEPADEASGLEAPEPPELSEAGAEATGSVGNALRGVPSQPAPADRGRTAMEDLPADDRRGAANAPASIPSTVELTPATGGWRSGRKRR